MSHLPSSGSTEGEQTEKSPSDEGFTDLEPTVNGSTEDSDGMFPKPLQIVNRDPQELRPGCPEQADFQDKSKLCQTKRKLDDEEDEGLAQNSSIEEGELIQSSLETEKQGEEKAETKDIQPKGTEELLNDTCNENITTPVDQNGKSSLGEAAKDCGTSSPERQTGGSALSDEERRKKNYEAEVKSWLLERMQAPIEGKNHQLCIKPEITVTVTIQCTLFLLT